MKPQSTSATETMTSPSSLPRAQELTRRGALRETIGRQVARLCYQTHGESLRAVVLTGSLARDEATLVEERKSWRLLGDAEFLVIFHARTSLPPKVVMGFLRQNIETSISRLGIAGEVCLSAAHPSYLRRLQPHIFAYELRNCGKVLWGDSEILTCIPSFSTSDIPLEDGWRLLSNRMVEQLEELEGLELRPKVLPRRLLYRTIKLYIDMATSYLLFAGEYAPTYAERAERLRKLADAQVTGEKAPFELRRFSDRVSECTQWKLTGTEICSSSDLARSGELGFSWWEEAIEYAQLLWRWELAFLAKTTGQASNQELMERWMKRQPISRRLRGWLRVVRDQGLDRSWKNWPHWAGLAWGGSPRYRVYQAASEVFFELPCLLKDAEKFLQGNSGWEKVRSFLPVVLTSEQSQKLSDWRGLAKEIAWNYKKFLVETQS
jgi:hypothetical protein